MLGLFVATAYGAETTPMVLQGIGIQERLGAQVSLDLPFTNETGQKVPLKNYFDGKKPVVLILAYYKCPNICNYLLQGATNSLSKLVWRVGEEFETVVISIDPKETPDIAAKKGESFKNWHLLTGVEKNVQQVASEVGFQYHYDEKEKQYAHAAGIFFLTPSGKVARALHGIEFGSQDLKLALVEASQGKIGTVVDKLLFYCYRYDSTNKRYVLASNLMKGGGAATILLLGFLIFGLNRKNKK